MPNSVFFYSNSIVLPIILYTMSKRIGEGFKGERAIILPYNIRDLLAKNPITEQLYVTHIGYYPFAKYHYRKREKGTNQYILIFCEKGSGWIEFNDEVHRLTREMTFILPPNQPHAYGADDKTPWSIYWMHFKGSKTSMFSQIFNKIIDTPVSFDSRNLDRILLFEEIYQNLEMGYSVENLEYTTFCLMYFLASLKYVVQYREVKKPKELDVIQKSILYMKDNLENKITLDDIAHSVGYSSSHFSNYFTQKTNFPPYDYYNQLKIQKACSYLQFSDLKIKEIAYKLGYFDQFHFSKSFKKEMEMSPKDYRKKYNP